MPRGWSGPASVAERRVHTHATPAYKAFRELPIPTLNILGAKLPVAGGNYLRQFPAPLMRTALNRWAAAGAAPIVFYFHVWDLDPGLPELSGTGPFARLRHFRNLDRMASRIDDVLGRYRFAPAAAHLELIPQPVTVAAPAGTAATESQIAREILGAPPAAPRPVSLVIPCYNEEATLGYLIKALDAFERRYKAYFELSYIFVDDGSRDATWAKLDELFGGRPRTQLLRHAENRGIGAATMTGIKAAQTEIVASIDCDCSFDPEQMTKLLPLMTDGVDLVTASPYHRDGGVVNVPAWRLLFSKGASWLYRGVLSHKFASYTACFRVYRKRAVEDLVLENEGFLGITEILARMDGRGATIVECPAVLEARVTGQSKMRVLQVTLDHMRFLARLYGRRWGLIGSGDGKNKAEGEPNQAHGTDASGQYQ